MTLLEAIALFVFYGLLMIIPIGTYFENRELRKEVEKEEEKVVKVTEEKQERDT